jgi:hypothetical protein
MASKPVLTKVKVDDLKNSTKKKAIELLTKRGKLKTIEIDLDVEKKEVSKQLLDFITELKVDTIYADDLGSVTYYPESESVSVDKTKLEAALVGAGLSARQIDKIKQACYKKSEKASYVKYTQPKAKI